MTSGGTPAARVAVGGFVAFAEGVELVGEREHEVACELVVLHIVDIVGRNLALYVRFLLEKIVDLQHHRGCTPCHELIGYGGVPHPCVGVEALGVALGGGVGEVGGKHQPERRIVGAVECAAIVVNGGGLDVLYAVKGVLAGRAAIIIRSDLCQPEVILSSLVKPLSKPLKPSVRAAAI